MFCWEAVKRGETLDVLQPVSSWERPRWGRLLALQGLWSKCRKQVSTQAPGDGSHSQVILAGALGRLGLLPA